MDNTGYKLATRILLTVTTGGHAVEHSYPIGKYADGTFVALTENEISVLTDVEYKECISMTATYILDKEGIKYIEDLTDIMSNEAIVQDHYMCPILLPVNKIAASAATVLGNDVSITYTADHPAGSDVTVVLSYQGDSFTAVLQKGKNTVSAIVPKKFWGMEVLLSLYVGSEGIVSDSVYSYSIQRSILLPDIDSAEIVDNSPMVHFSTDSYGRPTVNLSFPYLTKENVDVRMMWAESDGQGGFIGGGTFTFNSISSGTKVASFVRTYTVGAADQFYVRIEKVGDNSTVVDGYIVGDGQKYKQIPYEQNPTRD
jgi:hypothetical protein